jgi:hypothetical protein
MQDLISLQVELSVYRKGCLTVQLNFQEGIMTWMESRQWCNNFVRSLSDEQVRETISIVEKTGMPDAVPAAEKAVQSALEQADPGDLRPARSGDVTAETGSSLRFLLSFPESQVELSGEVIIPSAWATLRNQIEKLSRVPFQL